MLFPICNQKFLFVYILYQEWILLFCYIWVDFVTVKYLIFCQDIFPDKATERNILSCHVRCPSKGCEWTGEIRNLEVIHFLHSFKSQRSCVERSFNLFCNDEQDANLNLRSLLTWKCAKAAFDKSNIVTSQSNFFQC